MNRHAWKRTISFLTAVLLVVSLFIPLSEAKAEDSITVAEAIADNSGKKTVEGYITAHTKSTGNYTFTPPFNDDFNLVLADSPDETDPAKLLPVQLPAAFRAEFGLKSNPGNIGKKVKITGSLESYFTVPGLKTPTEMAFTEDNATPKAAKAAADPAPGAVSKGTSVTLSTETTGASIHYTVDGTEPDESSTLYTNPIQINEDTVIKAVVIAEGTLNSDITVFTYKIAKEGLRIHDIQGAGHYSSYQDAYVSGVEGVVTHVADKDNFYMQDRKPDLDLRTSEGILVYKRDHGAASGDMVKVNGQVKEWVLEGYGEKLQTDLPVTEINASAITKLSSGNKLPAPVLVDGLISQPDKIIDNDQFGKFDPWQDGIDYYEAMEGMRVVITNPKVIAPQEYGELYVVSSSKKVNTNAGGLTINAKDYNPEKILIDINDSSFIAKAGDSFKGNIIGVVSYGYSQFKVLTDKAQLPQFKEGKTKPTVTSLKGGKEKLTVATYNIENYSTKTSDEKTERLAKAIVNNMKAPDIIGLTEVQDSDGSTNSGDTDAAGSYQKLIDSIKAAGGPEYAFTDIAPENNEDGGAPGGNIRVGFLYNPERVTLDEGKKGTATEAAAYENGKLTLNPGRIDPLNPAFEDSRKPLAAQFKFQGEKVLVIANHFNSKGGDQPLFGKNQPAVLSSEAQRNEIAKVVNGFVKDVQSKNPKANVIVLGDLNDFEFSAPLQLLKGRQLTNMIEKVPSSERYTYTYQGNSQVLDHILLSNHLAKSTKVDIVHINSVFMEEHGRASDHDPVIIQTELKKNKNGKPGWKHKHPKGQHQHAQ